MKIVKPSTASEKQTKTTMDTVELTQKLVASWRSPPFQRDLRINNKVVAVAEEIAAAGGVVPGILTVGVLDGTAYVVDGQHRLAAWQQTGLDVGYADVRTHWFDDMGEMANEFVKLNSSLVRLRPDDILRGMEPSTVSLQRIRRKCPFIGYDMVRRGEKSPVLSMSTYVRVWEAARMDVPQAHGSLQALASFDDTETTQAIEFANIAYEAWHRDPEYARLWGTLNLTLCAWLYRRSVLGERQAANSRAVRLTRDEFRKCLMALSADSQYLDYLVGRLLADRDRAPAFSRIKSVFTRRYQQETGKTLKLPQPPWAHK
jgi:hypothetical protein